MQKTRERERKSYLISCEWIVADCERGNQKKETTQAKNISSTTYKREKES